LEGGSNVQMKKMYMMIILLVFAWPLYYLYQRQLGAISFLLLAIFFLVITVKETKRYKQQGEKSNNHTKREQR
jgi:c-di-AMP phosphodiesterase-like protein